MRGIQNIPEVVCLDSRTSLIRIPGEQDVPITPRIRQLVDSQPFRRLASIQQLGLVGLVYPGATHSRFEHSLGVYRMTLLFLRRLATDNRFCELVTPRRAEILIVAALLHDIGHWPYCHPIEDMRLPDIPSHESLARTQFDDSEIEEIVKQQFDFSIDDVSSLLEGNDNHPATSILHTMLSGPVDVDKMDYLYRDSLHAGVPYGMHYDRNRLIGSLCLDKTGTSLAITDKGCTAAELMVFARYVMFREVYWHHAVRSATAMLQRSFFELRGTVINDDLFQMTDRAFQQFLLSRAGHSEVEPMVQGLFGTRRKLYKRLAQFNVHEHRNLFERISRRRYDWLVRCAKNLSRIISQASDRRLLPADILIDAPPHELEVQFKIDVRHGNEDYRPMQEVSPVVKTLAAEQFDNFVKQIRVFVNPDFGDLRHSNLNFVELLNLAVDKTEAN